VLKDDATLSIFVTVHLSTMNNQLEQWFYAVPPITRTYMTAAVLTTLACVRCTRTLAVSRVVVQPNHPFATQQMQVVTPFKLYFDLNLVLYKYEVGRSVVPSLANWVTQWALALAAAHKLFLLRHTGDRRYLSPVLHVRFHLRTAD